MNARVLLLIGIATAPVLGPPVAMGFQGRYLGSYVVTEELDERSSLQHRYDVSGQRMLTPEIDMNLNASLRYSTEPGRDDTELLRSRFFGNIRGPRWRVRGQLIPWQDRSPGPNSSLPGTAALRRRPSMCTDRFTSVDATSATPMAMRSTIRPHSSLPAAERVAVCTATSR